MRVWLTVLFVLVTAFAAVTAYEIVHPILARPSTGRARPPSSRSGTSSKNRCRRLSERGEDLTEQRINSFARSHGLQWGIVQAEGNGGLNRRRGTWTTGRPGR